MDFEWTDEQEALRADAVDFARRFLNDGVEADDRDERFPRDKWDRIAGWGYFGLPVPEADGGAGADYLTALAVTEGLGEGCVDGGLAFAAAVQLWDVVVPLARFGNDDQRARYLPGLVSGSVVGAIAITEPGSGSDAFAMETRAVPVDGGWRLHGAKAFITLAPVADLVICLAVTGEGGAMGGVSAFLLDTGEAGVTLGRAMGKMGMRTAPLGEIALDGAFVAEANLLGRLGFGLAVFNDALEWERIFGMAIHLGILGRELARARAYAKEREAFGQPIAKFQSVANKLVDMKVRLETSRLLLYRAACLKAAGRPALADAAMAKLWLGECAVANGLDALQVHGAYGYVSEGGVERHVRDAVAARLYAGTSEIQRTIIARSMGL